MRVIGLAAASDETAADPLARLFTNQQARLFRLARRLCTSHEEAKDLVQQTFVRVLASSSRLPADQDGQESWLVTTMVNLARDHGRRRAVSLKIASGAAPLAGFDEGFKERATHRQVVEVMRPAGGSSDEHVELQSRLELPPGRYQVRVAAEQGQDAGGVFTRVEMPDFSKASLSVSGLVLGRPRSGEARDVVADLVPVLPTTARVLRPTDPIAAFLRVYQGGRDVAQSVRVRAQILDAAGRQVFDEARELPASSFGTERAADYRLEMPLPRLEAGEHLLTIEVTDGKATLRRDVRFTVHGSGSSGGDHRQR